MFDKIMSLFGKKQEIVEVPRVCLTTNAPKTWPKVWVEETDLHKPAPLFLSAFAGALKNKMGQCGGQLTAVCVTRISKKGILDVPCEAELNGETAAVFAYSTADKEAEKHYAVAREFLKAKYNMPAYYYAPKKLEAASGGQPFRPFDLGDLESIGDVKLKGNYARWWPARLNENLIGTAAQKAMYKAYKALDGYEPYMLAAIEKSLGACDEETMRMELPKVEQLIPVRAPEGQTIALCVSQEKGIGFKFNADEIPIGYRDGFLALFADFAEKFKQDTIAKKLPIERNLKQRPFRWYLDLEESIKMSKVYKL